MGLATQSLFVNQHVRLHIIVWHSKQHISIAFLLSTAIGVVEGR
jgi:hypothetical protein